MKAPHITASQESSQRPWARRTRLCWLNFIFSSAMAYYNATISAKTREKREIRSLSRCDEKLTELTRERESGFSVVRTLQLE